MKPTTILLCVLVRAGASWAQVPPEAPPGAPLTRALSSDEGPGFTLEDALAATRRAHPMISSARASLRAAGSDVVSAGLWTNPVFTLNYARSFGFTTYHPALGMPQAGVSQLLETSGLPSARQRAAELLQGASRADLQAMEVGLGFELRLAAIELARAQVALEIYRDAQGDFELADAVVRARVGAGAAPRYDASRMTLALAEARADTYEAEADLVRARGALDVAVGPEAPSLRGALRLDLLAAPELHPLSTLAAALEARPDLVAARGRAGAARAGIEVARRSVVQGVSVYAGSILGAGAGNRDELQVDLSLGLSVPLAILDRGQGTIPAAERRAEAMSHGVDSWVLAARQRLAALWREVERRRRTESSYNAVDSSGAMGMRREAEVGYREGRLSILELVDAYSAFRGARLRRAVLAGESRVAEVLLGRVAGVPATAP